MLFSPVAHFPSAFRRHAVMLIGVLRLPSVCERLLAFVCLVPHILPRLYTATLCPMQSRISFRHLQNPWRRKDYFFILAEVFAYIIRSYLAGNSAEIPHHRVLRLPWKAAKSWSTRSAPILHKARKGKCIVNLKGHHDSCLLGRCFGTPQSHFSSAQNHDCCVPNSQTKLQTHGALTGVIPF